MKPYQTPELSFLDVLAARERLRGGIPMTPCTESPGLSRLTGSRIFCKHEYLQSTGSFKERGARNALSLLPSPKARRGVVAASAGNHALGLAWHGRALGIPVTVVMPRSAARVKIDQCRSLGAEVILAAETFDQARSRAMQLAWERGVPNVHPFDDPAVIAGQGTVVLEVIEQVRECDAVVVPVGGGGLLAGVAMTLRALRPEVAVIGVEPNHAPCFSTALACGQPTFVPTCRTLADGLAVAQAGSRAFQIAAPLVDRLVTVTESALAAAIRCIGETEGAVVEGAGAAPLAAILSGQLPEFHGKKLVLLLTGRNIDPAVHRAALAESRIWPSGRSQSSAWAGESVRGARAAVAGRAAEPEVGAGGVSG